MEKNLVVPFQFKGRELRTVVIEDEYLWVAKDVAETLGYINTKDAISKHCRGVAKCYPIIDRLGRTQKVRVIHEPDLYRLIVGSQLPEAQAFEAWVFEDVLPSIRKTGQYARQEPVPADCQLVPTAEYIGLLKEKIAWLEGRGQETVKRPPRLPLSQDEVAEIRRLKGLGHSLREVAGLTGRSRATVSLVCRDLRQEVAR